MGGIFTGAGESFLRSEQGFCSLFTRHVGIVVVIHHIIKQQERWELLSLCMTLLLDRLVFGLEVEEKSTVKKSKFSQPPLGVAQHHIDIQTRAKFFGVSFVVTEIKHRTACRQQSKGLLLFQKALLYFTSSKYCRNTFGCKRYHDICLQVCALKQDLDQHLDSAELQQMEIFEADF